MANVHNQPSRIFLVGMMGSGKTTIGRGIAEVLGRPFVDLDDAIEKRTNRTINDIFENSGEFHFRTCEAQVLRDLPRKFPNAVIATGGGTPLHFNNMDFLNDNGLTIFLDIDIQMLVERLADQREARPLLRRDDWETFLTGLAEQRKTAYERAQVSLEVSSNDPGVAIDNIIAQLPQVVGH
ncbi:MAG: shikimate kinase [Saprospiraceae bacterium]